MTSEQFLAAIAACEVSATYPSLQRTHAPPAESGAVFVFSGTGIASALPWDCYILGGSLYLYYGDAKEMPKLYSNKVLRTALDYVADWSKAAHQTMPLEYEL